MSNRISRRHLLKVTALAVAGAAAAPLASACTPQAAPTAAPPASGGATTKAPAAGKPGLESLRGQTVTALVSDHPIITTIQTIIPEFEEKTGIKVQFDKVAAKSLAEKILLTRDSKEYDILMLQGDELPNYAYLDLLSPIDDLVKSELKDPEFSLDGLVQSWLDNSKYDGKLYSIPSSMEAGILYYRKDLFKKYLDGKAPPKTYAEYLEDAKKLNLKEKDVYGQTWRGVNTQQWMYLIPAWGEKWFDANWNPKFLTPGHQEIAQYMLEAAKYSPPGWQAWEYQEVWAAMQQGNVAMIIDASVAPTLVDPKVSKLTWNELGVTIPPTTPKGLAKWNGASGQTLGLAKNAQHREAAYKVIEWPAIPRNDKKLVGKGRVPHVMANYKDAELLKEFPMLEGVGAALEGSMRCNGPDDCFRPRSPGFRVMRNEMTEIYKAWTSGKTAIKPALEQLQATMEKLVVEYKLRK